MPARPRARVRRLPVLVALALIWSALVVLTTGVASNGAENPELVPSERETVPVFHAGDAMDDPAVWVHPTDPARSLLMGNDKAGGFETYDLDGSRVQRLSFSTQFWGNVDVRQGVQVNGRTHDLIGVVQRGVRVYTVDPATRLLAAVTEGAAPIGVSGEGFCLYRSAVTAKVYGISITNPGVLSQFELTDVDADGLLESTTVRSFSIGSEAEGCVADDDTGALYVSEENTGVWRYSAEPGGGTARQSVDVLDSAGGHLVNDVEGVTLVDRADGGGYVIVSAQHAANPHASYFTVYRRDTNAFVKSFRISNGTGSDDCDKTDGITAVTASLGPAFPRGMFVCQDNNNDAPGATGNQSLKMVRLETVVDLDGGGEPPPPPPPPAPISFVGQAARNTSGTSFTVQVPTGVQAGDALLLFASRATNASLTGPGSGWTQAGRVADGEVTTVWRRVATATDAGSTVRLSSGSTSVKVAMTLAAYRGTHATNPVASIAGAAEPRSTATHTTPSVPNTTAGAWRVSYWSDKNSATRTWTAPVGETTRATTVGTGSGRVGSLLSDSAAPLTAGSPATTGARAATASAVSSTATMWTLLLRPAA